MQESGDPTFMSVDLLLLVQASLKSTSLTIAIKLEVDHPMELEEEVGVELTMEEEEGDLRQATDLHQVVNKVIMTQV